MHHMSAHNFNNISLTSTRRVHIISVPTRRLLLVVDVKIISSGNTSGM